MADNTNIMEKARAAGITGMGGAGFPSYIKLQSKASVIIANGVECEPLLRSDYHCMIRDTDSVIAGLNLAAEAVGAERKIIAVKKKRNELLEKLSSTADNDIEIAGINDFYPAGDEFTLTHEVTGKIIPEGGLPLDVGVVVHNVATLAAIANASARNPLVSRLVTVAGAVKQPVTASVPIGTSIEYMLELAGGPSIDDFAILSGGVMMGEEVTGEDVIKKTTSGLVVLPSDHPAVKDQNVDTGRIYKIARSVCDQCYTCSEYCPRLHLGHHIEPHKIMRMISFQLEQDADATSIAHYCCLCGLCTLFACPLGISPRKVIEELRGKVKIPSAPPAPRPPAPMAEYKKTPVSRLLSRLRLESYDKQENIFLENIPPVDVVRIPLRQSIGEPPEPVVKKGDRVKTGTEIAAAVEEKVSVCAHASIDGTVVEVSDKYITIEA